MQPVLSSIKRPGTGKTVQKMKTFIYSLLVLILYTPTVYAAGDASFALMQKKFVRTLYNGQRYFDCIAEARRLQVEDKTPELDYFIYMNYYLAGEFRTVAAGYNYSESTLGICSGILVSMSYLRLDMYAESYNTLKSYHYTGDPGSDITLFMYRLKPLLLSGDFDGMEVEESAAERFLKDEYNFTALREELSRFRESGMKSPLKSSIMSAVVPGLGQVYSGYPGEGLLSLASVALTAMGGVYMRNRGMDGYSYTLFFFSGLFHAGNIYGAWNSAERKNSVLAGDEYRLIENRYGEYNPGECVDLERLLN